VDRRYSRYAACFGVGHLAALPDRAFAVGFLELVFLACSAWPVFFFAFPRFPPGVFLVLAAAGST
jgi:hypothetical protein